jgi:hypothetical protein
MSNLLLKKSEAIRKLNPYITNKDQFYKFCNYYKISKIKNLYFREGVIDTYKKIFLNEIKILDGEFYYHKMFGLEVKPFNKK